MSRLTRLILLISLGLNLGLGWNLLRAQRAEGPRPPVVGRGWRDHPAPEDSASWHRLMQKRVDRLASLLALEPEQTAQLEQLQKSNAPLVRAQRECVEVARLRVREVAAADFGDDAVIRSALAGLRRAQAGLDSLTQEFLMQEFAVMTAPQRARYLELLPLDPWRSGRSGGHGGPGDRAGEPGRSGNRRHREE
jgi:Spy/CpxP family protein refolding chaperone